MRFNNPRYENEELTYDDVFLFQQYFDGKSRISDTNIVPETPLSTTIPLVSSNMNPVTGKRMGETIARYGGLGVLPQDMSLDKMLEIIKFIHNADIRLDTPLTVKENNNVRDALGIIKKRDHNCVVLINKDNFPIGVFTPSDLKEIDQYAKLGGIKRRKLITGDEFINDRDAFEIMEENGITSLPIIKENGEIKGILTKQNTVRNSIYTPNINRDGNLNVAVALGVNNYHKKIEQLLDVGIDTFVLDTAHGYQKTMIEAIRRCKNIMGESKQIIAGNVSTADGVEALIKAGANGVKVGIGPGAMCTTRIQTGVGRPQFSSVLECSQKVRELGGYVWADGGLKHPRDLVLAIVAGATHAMVGTVLSGTYESPGDLREDENGQYKVNYGMASGKAVGLRTEGLDTFDQTRAKMFKEGISKSKIYLKEGSRSVGDVVDEYTTGLRSAMTYIGAKNLEELSDKAIIGVQTNAGYKEGTPHGRIKL